MTEHARRDISEEPAHPQPGRAEPSTPEEGTAGEPPATEVTGGRTAPADRPGGPAPERPAVEFEDRWRRAAADLDNLRKRFARDVERERAAERAVVASAFLPVIDDIDRALEHAGSNPQAIIDGIRHVREQALAVLAALGFRRDDAAGVPFDPARHEVVGVVGAEDTGTEPGAVASVVRPGYGGPPGRQLRPAAVTVAQPQED